METALILSVDETVEAPQWEETGELGLGGFFLKMNVNLSGPKEYYFALQRKPRAS